MAKYKDANFRSVHGHRTDARNNPVPVTVYSYEGSSKMYDIVVDLDDRYKFVCRERSKKCDPGAIHREIDKHFNLDLPL